MAERCKVFQVSLGWVPKLLLGLDWGPLSWSVRLGFLVQALEKKGDLRARVSHWHVKTHMTDTVAEDLSTGAQAKFNLRQGN